MCKRDMEKNVDYRKMYYAMAAEVGNAIALLIRVQQKCEDILLENAEEEQGSSVD